MVLTVDKGVAMVVLGRLHTRLHTKGRQPSRTNLSKYLED